MGFKQFIVDCSGYIQNFKRIDIDVYSFIGILLLSDISDSFITLYGDLFTMGIE